MTVFFNIFILLLTISLPSCVSYQANLSFSVGFTSDMVLQHQSTAAVYGLVYGPGTIRVVVTNDLTGDSYSISEQEVTTAGIPSAMCSQRCVEHGFACRGSSSACLLPSCD